MSSHARLSPSARHRWGKCPQAPRQEVKYPDAPSSQVAIDGTHTHTLLGMCLEGGMSPSTLIDTELRDHEGLFLVTAERAERVELALRYVVERQFGLGPSCQMFSEVECDPGKLFSRDDLGGTSDIVLISDTVIEVIDYKDGMSPVIAKDNPQLEQYVWGVIASLDIPIHAIKQPTIRMTIVQPKMREKNLPPIVWHELPTNEFLNGFLTLQQQAIATDDPDASFNPGEDQCKYCRHKGACVALTNQMMEASGVSFQSLDIAKQAAEQDPHCLSDTQLRELVEAAPLLRQLIDAAEVEALRRFESGTCIQGLKVVRGRGSRSWALGDDEVAEKLRKMGVPKEVIWSTSIISPSRMEKAKWVKRDGSQKQLSDRQLKIINNEYIKKSDGKLTVVSAADDRPAVDLNAASLFAAIDDLPSWLS